VSDDLFRARVEPRRAPAPTETWPEEFDERSDVVVDDLMAAFDRHRVELDRRLKPAAAEGSATSPDLAGADIAASEYAAGSAAAAAAESESAPDQPATGAAHRAVPQTASAAKPAGATALPSRRVVAEPRRRSRKPWVIAGAVLAVAAGTGTSIAAFANSDSTSGAASPTRSAPPSTVPPSTTPPSTAPAAPAPDSAAAQAAAAQAADWIAANVGPGHVVACDVTVCTLLSSRGFPAASLITVQSHLSEVEQADVVVVTDIIRHQLGASLAGVTADEPLAVFPTGASAGSSTDSSTSSSTVEITAVALDGPQSRAGRLAADREARRAAGAALLRNPRIVVAGNARAALSDGLVDTRVCTLLAVLGGTHTVTIASFTGTGPGAGADLPLPGVVISTVDGVSATAASPKAAALKTIVEAQRPPYTPLSVGPASSPNQGLAILFAQPGPIGLLGATTS
jgi:hypothetical protein